MAAITRNCGLARAQLVVEKIGTGRTSCGLRRNPNGKLFYRGDLIMTEEAKVTHATVRISEDGRGTESYDIECRFSDGQKFAAIQVDGEFPKLAQRICSALTLPETLWQPMTSAPKDGTVILALLTGSDIPYPIRWQDKELPEGSPPGWFVTWDNYRLTEMDGPMCWMRCPPEFKGSWDLAAIIRLKALDDIRTERERQISEEGYSPNHDDTYVAGELVKAAICYASNSVRNTNWYPGETPVDWPWEWEAWKPSTPLRDLIKAEALILAEIERLKRGQLNT